MDQIQKVIISLAEDQDTPRALSVAILARYGEYEEFQKLLPVHPHRYDDAKSYMRDLIPTEIIRKVDFGGDSRRKSRKALDTFFLCEAQCLRTNIRLFNFLNRSEFHSEGDGPLWFFIKAVKKEIRQILGRPPGDLCPRFSGGASTSTRAKKSTVPDKIEGRAHYYPDTSHFLPLWWETAWGRASYENAPQVIRYNVFFTVPKDNEKYRGCAKEATIPCSYQLAIASVLKKRIFERTGVDMETAQDLHRSLAQSASTDGLLATVDLSNASDTLSKVLVELLLPGEWFSLLNSLRAHLTKVGRRVILLEKFSSMGNGFTFELETLIFLSMARVACRLSGADPSDARCYGDDIIVPTEAFPILRSGLRFFGFTENRKKTFPEGPFRESCGGDFYDGVPVRAHYLEKMPNEPHEWISLTNGLYRLKNEGWLSAATWKLALAAIPSSIRRCRGPVELGDLVIHDRETSHLYRIEDHDGFSTKHFRAWMPVARVTPWSHWSPHVKLASCLFTESEGVVSRGAISGYRLGWVQDLVGACRWIPGLR